jgi:hypothetical protein
MQTAARSLALAQGIAYAEEAAAWVAAMIDWIWDPDSDDDETSPFGFNEDFESDCYGEDNE